jgi:hypothetical protein
MCTELFLALLYFFIIFLVNFFLYKLLKNYLENIFYLLKIKNIFTTYKNINDSLFVNLHLYTFKNINSRNLFKNFLLFSNSSDVIIIGNTYKTLNSKKKNNISKNFYFNLLEIQYLNKIID